MNGKEQRDIFSEATFTTYREQKVWNGSARVWMVRKRSTIKAAIEDFVGPKR